MDCKQFNAHITSGFLHSTVVILVNPRIRQELIDLQSIVLSAHNRNASLSCQEISLATSLLFQSVN